MVSLLYFKPSKYNNEEIIYFIFIIKLMNERRIELKKDFIQDFRMGMFSKLSVHCPARKLSAKHINVPTL